MPQPTVKVNEIEEMFEVFFKRHGSLVHSSVDRGILGHKELQTFLDTLASEGISPLKIRRVSVHNVLISTKGEIQMSTPTAMPAPMAMGLTVFLSECPVDLRPRQFYSIDRTSIYRAMGFTSRTGFGDPKLPTSKGWKKWVTEAVRQGFKHNINQGSLGKWDYDSVDFGPLDLYNVKLEWINDPQFDKVREGIQEGMFKKYGEASQWRSVKPIEHYTLERTFLGRLNVKLMPPYTPKDGHTPFQGDSGRKRKPDEKGYSFQRVLVQCPRCMQWQYFGRLNQHMYNGSRSKSERSRVCIQGEELLKRKEGR